MQCFLLQTISVCTAWVDTTCEPRYPLWAHALRACARFNTFDQPELRQVTTASALLPCLMSLCCGWCQLHSLCMAGLKAMAMLPAAVDAFDKCYHGAHQGGSRPFRGTVDDCSVLKGLGLAYQLGDCCLTAAPHCINIRDAADKVYFTGI